MTGGAEEQRAKEDVNYRYSTDERRRCESCAHADPPSACLRVSGLIRRVDVCDLFERAKEGGKVGGEKKSRESRCRISSGMKVFTLEAAVREQRRMEGIAYERPLGESAPPGWEGTVKRMKRHPEIDNPWALAHWMSGRGYEPHAGPRGGKGEAAAEVEPLSGASGQSPFTGISRDSESGGVPAPNPRGAGHMSDREVRRVIARMRMPREDKRWLLGQALARVPGARFVIRAHQIRQQRAAGDPAAPPPIRPYAAEGETSDPGTVTARGLLPKGAARVQKGTQGWLGVRDAKGRPLPWITPKASPRAGIRLKARLGRASEIVSRDSEGEEFRRLRQGEAARRDPEKYCPHCVHQAIKAGGYKFARHLKQPIGKPSKVYSNPSGAQIVVHASGEWARRSPSGKVTRGYEAEGSMGRAERLRDLAIRHRQVGSPKASGYAKRAMAEFKRSGTPHDFARARVFPKGPGDVRFSTKASKALRRAGVPAYKYKTTEGGAYRSSTHAVMYDGGYHSAYRSLGAAKRAAKKLRQGMTRGGRRADAFVVRVPLQLRKLGIGMDALAPGTR